MSRAEKSEAKRKKLFGTSRPILCEAEPEFEGILNRFLFGDVYYYGNLDDRIRQLLTLAVLVTNQAHSQLQAHTEAALRIGVTPVEIVETVYQCAPYIGFPKTLDAMNSIYAVFSLRNIVLPAESRKRTEENTRFEEGLRIRTEIFGSKTYHTVMDAPAREKHLQEYLCAFCFGDFYARDGLDLKTRELLTFCILSALGGCESQVKAHIQGNINVGNGLDTLIAAITHCIPYIGFPRVLNAMACVAEQQVQYEIRQPQK